MQYAVQEGTVTNNILPMQQITNNLLMGCACCVPTLTAALNAGSRSTWPSPACHDQFTELGMRGRCCRFGKQLEPLKAIHTKSLFTHQLVPNTWAIQA